MKGKYLEPTIECNCSEESLATEATKERRYTWLNARGRLVSRKLTEYECRLEDDVEKLQEALFSISSHYAKIQFRLRQIASATDSERISLLRELERITYRDIDENRHNNELPTLLNDSQSLGNVRIKQQKIISQLRGRLRDLVEVSDCCFSAKSEHIYQLRRPQQLQQEPARTMDLCVTCREAIPKQNDNPTPQERGYLSETWPSHMTPNDASFPVKRKSKSKKKRRKAHKSPSSPASYKRYSPDRSTKPSAGKSYAECVASHQERSRCRGNQDVSRKTEESNQKRRQTTINRSQDPKGYTKNEKNPNINRKTQQSESAKNQNRRQIVNGSPKPKRNMDNESNQNINRKTQESNHNIYRKTQESNQNSYRKTHENNQNSYRKTPENNQNIYRKTKESKMKPNRDKENEYNQDDGRKLQETEYVNDQDVPRRDSKSKDSSTERVVNKRKIRSRIVFANDHYQSDGPSNHQTNSSSQLPSGKYSHSPIGANPIRQVRSDDNAKSMTICQRRACKGKCSTTGTCRHRYKDNDDLDQDKKAPLKNVQFCKRATCSELREKESKTDKKETRKARMLHKVTNPLYSGLQHQNNFAECTRSSFLVYPNKYGAQNFAKNDRCLSFSCKLRERSANHKRDSCDKIEDSKSTQEPKPGDETTDC
ncbi:peptidyl-prolyl cis-trans isomerase G [Drosophila grimshawi]|uniref:peptidyl-prolyl cis-trans isomerase G n=1 Tax=Drosophila grimshawi TaxID=7222 RepID=UPI000C8706F3|nr:peptidyl-prolyl cis-trans isomerase G [Drosophila grimshawi]